MSIFEVCEPVLEDIQLLRDLNLPAWKAQAMEETYLGDVTQISSRGDDQSRIEVFVTPMPTQFYRFEIYRRSEESNEMETLTVKTGSGTLTQYWPMVQAIARHMLVVSPAQPVA